MGVQYTGLATEDHRALKMWCAATDRTIGSVREEAMTRQMEGSPGMDLLKDVIGQVREAVAQAAQAEALSANQPKKVNGKTK